MEELEGTFKFKRVGNGYVTTVEAEGIVKQEVDEEEGAYPIYDLIKSIENVLLRRKEVADDIKHHEKAIAKLKEEQ